VQEVFNIIRRLKEAGTTLLLVEQFAKSALEVADYAYVMEHGRIALAGTPAELHKNERMLALIWGKSSQPGLTIAAIYLLRPPSASSGHPINFPKADIQPWRMANDFDRLCPYY